MQVRSRLGLSLKVLRHEAFAAAGAESVGELIIFDMDRSDVSKEVGNTKVFCQDPANYQLAPYETLSAEMKAAVRQMLELELHPAAADAVHVSRDDDAT